MSEHAPALVDIQGLTKTYEHRGKRLEVLRGVDLRIHAGDRVAITGASGAGKSTLLQVLGTLDVPTSGRILFDGEDVFQRTPSALAAFRNREIGFVFQFHHLLPEFTALENVMMPGLIRRLKRQEAEERAVELLGRVGLAERMLHQPGELSGGEQQRVAIARALFNRPRLLLTDEPTGNLDLKTGAGIHGILHELNASMGVTVVVVTHDPNLARSMPVRLVMDAGRLVAAEGAEDGVGGRVAPETDDAPESPPSPSRPESSLA